MKTRSLNTILFACLILFTFTNCSMQNPVPLSSNLYEYHIQNAKGDKLSMSRLSDELAKVDVILVGEWHAHAGIHLFQAKLFSALIHQNSITHIALSMEQFDRASQGVIDDYLAGKIGEHRLIKQTNAWSNYQSDYRPLIELAKQHQLDVIAANTTRKIIQCLAKNGQSCLQTLSIDEKKLVAEKLHTQESKYKQKFFNSMHRGLSQVHSIKNIENQYIAQTAWDDTMAESIVNYLNMHPKAKVMHIAGAFHVEEGLGIASRIHLRNPSLKIAIISPVSVREKKQTQSNDFQLIVNELPKQWINEKEMQQSLSKNAN